MQQTEKYKFNLIDTSDPFSPEALNVNAETAERELARVDAAHAADKAEMTEALAALKSDVKPGAGGKMARVAWGAVTNGNTSLSLNFSFRPLLAILGGGIAAGSPSAEILVRGWTRAASAGPSTNDTVSWTDTGFTFNLISGNFTNRTIYYVVIGEALD